jgi:hypothetical protein
MPTTSSPDRKALTKATHWLSSGKVVFVLSVTAANTGVLFLLTCGTCTAYGQMLFLSLRPLSLVITPTWPAKQVSLIKFGKIWTCTGLVFTTLVWVSGTTSGASMALVGTTARGMLARCQARFRITSMLTELLLLLLWTAFSRLQLRLVLSITSTTSWLRLGLCPELTTVLILTRALLERWSSSLGTVLWLAAWMKTGRVI